MALLFQEQHESEPEHPFGRPPGSRQRTARRRIMRRSIDCRPWPPLNRSLRPRAFDRCAWRISLINTPELSPKSRSVFETLSHAGVALTEGYFRRTDRRSQVNGGSCSDCSIRMSCTRFGHSTRHWLIDSTGRSARRAFFISMNDHANSGARIGWSVQWNWHRRAYLDCLQL